MKLVNRHSIAAALVLVLIGTLGLTEAVGWIGKPFPGFLLLENRVVASVGLSRWPGTAGGEIYQHQVLSVNGQTVHSVDEIQEHVQTVPVGTAVEYSLRQGDEELVRVVNTRRFALADFLLLFGMYILNGLALGGAALAALRARKAYPAAGATVPLLLVGALWALTALDLYGPYRLFRLHAACEVLLFPATLHMALGFPKPARFLAGRRWILGLPYALAAALGVPYQLGLYQGGIYVTTHLLATTAFGAALLVLLVSQVDRYLTATSMDVRARIRGLATGALLALSLPVVVTLAEALTGGRAPQNAIALTAFIFPLSIGYVVLRGDFSGTRAPETERLSSPVDSQPAA